MQLPKKPRKGDWQGPLTLAQTVNGIFSDDRQLSRLRLESFIWAAKGRACPTCSVEPFQQCLNMTDLSHLRAKVAWAGAGVKGKVRVNKWPHNDRIDWQRLYDALIERGYIDHG